MGSIKKARNISIGLRRNELIEPLDEEIAEQIQIQSKYQGYIAKQQEQVKNLKN